MAFDWNMVVYLLGIAAVWGGMKQEIKGLKEDFDRLEKKVEKHNNLVERMAIVEQSAKSAHHRIDDIKGGH